MLSRLRLRHFRNYSSLDMDFNAGLNLITGLNGQGKTNILEAVQYLSILRSFRTRKTNDLRQWGSSFFFVEGSLATRADETGPWKISISYAEGRRLRVDGQVVNKAADFIGRVRCIACVPEDIMIVKGGPAERRRFIDMLLCQYSRQYLGDLVNYKIALKSRNRMLKEPAKYDSHAFAAYDNLLVRYGASVICARQKFSFLFADLLGAEGTELFGGKSEVLLQYNPSVGLSVDERDEKAVHKVFQALLEKNFEKDLARGRTTCGPHLDDYNLKLDNFEAGEFGSEGQCRMISLALKLAAVDVLYEKKDAPLIMLVDDVLGELDIERRHSFYRNFAKVSQVIVASTDVPADLKDRASSIYRVQKGKAKRS